MSVSLPRNAMTHLAARGWGAVASRNPTGREQTERREAGRGTPAGPPVGGWGAPVAGRRVGDRHARDEGGSGVVLRELRLPRPRASVRGGVPSPAGLGESTPETRAKTGPQVVDARGLCAIPTICLCLAIAQSPANEDEAAPPYPFVTTEARQHARGTLSNVDEHVWVSFELQHPPKIQHRCMSVKHLFERQLEGQDEVRS